MSDEPADRLETVRLEVIKRLAELMEGQTRMKIFNVGVRRLASQIHSEMIDRLRSPLETGQRPPADIEKKLEDIIAQCSRLDLSLATLYDQRVRHWYRNGQHIQALTTKFNKLITESSYQFVEKELLEQQSRVLESVILSHEKVANWKEFLLAILAEFNQIFAFDVFFVAFREEGTASLYVYYLGEHSKAEKTSVRQKLTQRVIDELRLTNMRLEIEEFQIDAPTRPGAREDMTLLSALVPQHAPDLAGVLGVAYAAACELSPQEASIIRSILAVLMMIIGSSKVLSRTMAELEYYSVHDPLTALYNRRHFENILEYEISRSQRHRHSFSILLIDFDNFKGVNDSYGHVTGDEALRRVAGILGKRTRKGDSCFRVGGDEFFVVLTETTKDGARRVAESIRRSISEKEFLAPNDETFHITASIGVVTFPDDGQEIADLLAAADAAVYHAKDMGKNEACTLDGPAKEAVAAARMRRDFAEKLREALDDRRIVPFYQPIVDCHNGRPSAHEALMRMIQHDGAAIPAGVFMNAAEKYGLVRELDTTLFDQVMAAEHIWLRNGGRARKFFFNVSVQDLEKHLRYAVQACTRLSIAPENIVFEILERDAIEDIPSLRSFLEALRGQGFSFALDDFGSGYNSFHYLRELRFDYVKIDGAFVRNILDSEMNRILVRNLVKLCQDMDIRTVAEFVEDAETMNALIDMGVDYAQGYHLGKPAEAIAAH